MTGFRAVGQIRGNSAHATDSRIRAPAGSRNAVAVSGIVAVCSPVTRAEPELISVDLPSGVTMAIRATRWAPPSSDRQATRSTARARPATTSGSGSGSPV